MDDNSDQLSPLLPDNIILREDNYYKMLGIDRNASNIQIRDAFKQKTEMLELLTPNTDISSSGVYKILKNARDVLVEPNLRQIYDQYGEKGLKKLQNIGKGMDASILLNLNLIVSIIAFLSICILVFTLLLSLKIDGNFNTLYIYCFIPCFIAEGILLVSIFLNGFEPDEESISTKHYFFYLLVIILLEILICGKLDGFWKIEWWICFAPWFVIEITVFYDSTLLAIKKSQSLVDDEYADTLEGYFVQRRLTIPEKIDIYLRKLSLSLFRSTQIIFIVIKLSSLHWIQSWGVVFLPTLIGGIGGFFRLLYLAVHSNSGKAKSAVGKLILYILGISFIFLFVGLILHRIESESNEPKMSIIFMPIFIVFGMFAFCFSCCIPRWIFNCKQSLEIENE